MIMRILLLALFAAVLGAGTLSARELHRFQNPDTSKTFESRLKAFDPASAKVSVRLANGNPLTFPLTAVCTEDQEYIQKVGATLAVGSKVTVGAAENSKRGDKTAEGNYFVTKIDGGYRIDLTNLAKSDVSDFEVRYRLYYSDAENAVDKNKETVVKRALKYEEGTEKIGTLGIGEKKSIETKRVAMTEVKQKPAAQCTGGG